MSTPGMYVPVSNGTVLGITYTFVMPAGDVMVSATFKPQGGSVKRRF
jgi:hypothetical protein